MTTLDQKISQVEAQLARLRTESKRNQRRDDTAKKVLLGAFIMEWSSKNGGWPAGFNDWLTRERDRKLFGLPPRQKSED